MGSVLLQLFAFLQLTGFSLVSVIGTEPPLLTTVSFSEDKSDSTVAVPGPGGYRTVKPPSPKQRLAETTTFRMFVNNVTPRFSPPRWQSLDDFRRSRSF
jgi:hypothetical protein